MWWGSLWEALIVESQKWSFPTALLVDVCIYIYICICICMYMYMYVYVYVYVYVCVYIYIFIYLLYMLFGLFGTYLVYFVQFPLQLGRKPLSRGYPSLSLEQATRNYVERSIH